MSQKTSKLPERPGYAFFHYHQSAMQMGGDYYAAIRMANGRLALVIADPSPKGAETVIRMRQLVTELNRRLVLETDPAAAMRNLNDWHCHKYSSKDSFVMVAIAVLDPDMHELALVSAGHVMPIIRHFDGRVEEVDNQAVGMPLGLTGALYEQVAYSIGSGDVFVFFTGGLNAAMDDQGELYSMERLRRVTVNAGRGAIAVGEAIVADVKQLIGTRHIFHDLTLLVLGRE
ncbi:MAG: PP2C family protein-serine/threonine phosphatase [Planctomycetales bacterium]